MTDQNDRTLESFVIGESVSFERRFTPEDFVPFSRLSGDNNPLHHDADYAAQTLFGEIIVPLHLLAAPLSAIAGMMLPGHRSLYLSTRQRALKPAHYDQTITYSAKVTAKNDINRTLTIRTIAFHEADILLEAEQIVQVRMDVDAAMAPPRYTGFHSHIPGKRTALITGAIGHIGTALALALAKKGWNLLLLNRPQRQNESENLARRCKNFGVTASTLACDLTDTETLEKQLREIFKQHDITDLIHTASPGVQADPTELLAVNFSALVKLSRALLPSLLQRQDGRIFLLGSSAIHYGPPGWEAYTASKTAAANYLTTLNNRYVNHGLSSWVLAPGFVHTPFSKTLRGPDTLCLLPEQVAEAAVDLLTGKQGGNKGGYVWMEPGRSLQFGHFGFHGGAERQPVQESDHEPDSTEKPTNTDTSPRQGGASRNGQLEDMVRRFFNVADDHDLSEAGLDRFPGWDSLRHIELMLHLEKRLGIHFDSMEIDRTKQLTDLNRLIREKIDGPNST